MSAELVSCPECQRKLRVPNELVGKLVKCPTCGQTFTADPAAQAPPPTPAPARAENVVRTSKVSRDDKDEDDDRPRRRPRIDRDEDEDDDRPRRRRSRYSRDDDDDDDDDDVRRRRRRDLVPHRAGAVLTLGILALVLPFVFPLVGLVCGVIAWVMGNTDLAEMRAGRMDPEGQSQTNAGRICGMISVILHILVIVGGLGFCCLVGMFSGHH